MLVGNKSDLAETRRQVSSDEAVRLAKRLGLAGVYETSAKFDEQQAMTQSLATVDDVVFRSVLNCLDNKQ